MSWTQDKWAPAFPISVDGTHLILESLTGNKGPSGSQHTYLNFHQLYSALLHPKLPSDPQQYPSTLWLPPLSASSWLSNLPTLPPNGPARSALTSLFPYSDFKPRPSRTSTHSRPILPHQHHRLTCHKSPPPIPYLQCGGSEQATLRCRSGKQTTLS